MNIVILAGGRGQRFIDAGYSTPKPLIHYRGMPMIANVLQNQVIASDDTIFVAYNKELAAYSFETYIKSFKGFEKAVFLEMGETRSPCHTAYQAVSTFAPDKLVVLMDCDTFYTNDVLGRIRLMNCNGLICVKMDNPDKRFSYSRIHDGVVAQIAEKNPISNYANTGVYFWHEAGTCSGDLLKTIKMYGDNSYISSAISERVCCDSVLPLVVEQEQVRFIGTPEQLNEESGRVLCREWHSLAVIGDEVKKTGDIGAEEYWYSSANKIPCVPKTRTQDNAIFISRVRGIPYSDLYVSGKLNVRAYLDMEECLRNMHGCACDNNLECTIAANYLWKSKLQKRYELERMFYDELGNKNDVDFSSIVSEILRLDIREEQICFMHGDPVFSNVILDNGNPVFIDPRGNIDGITTNCGFSSYDLAKVLQSLLGYDHCIAGILPDAEYIKEWLALFFESNKQGKPYWESRVMSLIVSMLPLHKAENRFLDLICNCVIKRMEDYFDQ